MDRVAFCMEHFSTKPAEHVVMLIAHCRTLSVMSRKVTEDK